MISWRWHRTDPLARTCQGTGSRGRCKGFVLTELESSDDEQM
ncbi:hypothetical protein BN2537_851 [Streptomyces venezuelae]|nr:hypothetical protein BN2537_851 [Streptomyces venezuelae]